MPLLVALLPLALSVPAEPIERPADLNAPDWKIKKLQFSAVSIGVAMANHTTGWSSFTNGAEAIKITKTTDGGSTWTPVANQTKALMVMGVAASTTPSVDVVTTGLASTSYSIDGNHFLSSALGPFISQSVVAYSGGRVVLASGAAVYVSTNGGKSFSHKAVPAPVLQTPGRYAAAPSANVLYLTAGTWPAHTAATASEVQLTSQLRFVNRTFAIGGASRLGLETGAADESGGVFPPPGRDPPAGYAAQILKSSDGGATWTSLFLDTGAFYFNGIDCFDETHCVAVGEGFGHDGSTSPGARVYATSDGEKFELTHHEPTDGASLMAAKMFSAHEHVAGGRLPTGLTLHSTDAGKTYATKGATIKGQAITAMSFVSPTHGFATAVNGLQICSLLEYGAPSTRPF